MRGTEGVALTFREQARFIPAHAGNSLDGTVAHGAHGVHPRACGEQSMILQSSRSSAGSSPRMRGTDHDRPHAQGRRRFIPAHAGNRPDPPVRMVGMAVHPRACGEQLPAGWISGAVRGSSPRMRGTAINNIPAGHDNRFIPAHAGNRWKPMAGVPLRSVHPRACGEQLNGFWISQPDAGSSPRMRGTVRRHGHEGAGYRFIPAHAGNRVTSAAKNVARPVHPRACGEQPGLRAMRFYRPGSSPRMRGTGRDDGAAICRARFIPAHAGNSDVVVAGLPCQPVHPRACGEQRPIRRPASGTTGSSPRMRGTVSPADDTYCANRFIPAHAGNSSGAVRGILCHPVHPRACGEQQLARALRAVAGGSSPRMRGTAGPIGVHVPIWRFIPAHAGNRLLKVWRIPTRLVHPRACGEQQPPDRHHQALNGSSPRMRGTDDPEKLAGDRQRFIPAHAGNRAMPVAFAVTRPVHPRACGEQSRHGIGGLAEGGSSPRMRGTDLTLWLIGMCRRFIPAHAGNRGQDQQPGRTQAVHPRACGEQAARIGFRGADRGSSPRMRGTAVLGRRDNRNCRFIPAHAGNSPLWDWSRSGTAVHPRACGEQRSATSR